MTSTAWGIGATNALVCGLAILVFCYVIAAPVSLIYGQPLSDSFGFVFKVTWGFTILAFFGTWLYDRAHAGCVLFDCGPHPMRILLLICAGLPLISALMDERPIFNISMAALFLIVATGRLQVRENGIWLYSHLLGCGKIGSYRWADDFTLIVRRKGPLGFFRGALSVPPEHRQAIEDFLVECRVLHDPN